MRSGIRPRRGARYGGDRPAQYDSRLLEPGGPFVAFQGRTSMGTILRRVRWPAGPWPCWPADPSVCGRRGRRRAGSVGPTGPRTRDRADGDLAVIGVHGSVEKTTNEALCSPDARPSRPAGRPAGEPEQRDRPADHRVADRSDTRYAVCELMPAVPADVRLSRASGTPPESVSCEHRRFAPE